MNQNWCDERLKKLRYGLEKPGQEFGFWVFPQVYCVAYNETYKTMFYKQQGSSYVKIPASAELHQNVMGRENSYYHRATGSCKGEKVSNLLGVPKNAVYWLSSNHIFWTPGKLHCPVNFTQNPYNVLRYELEEYFLYRV